MNGFDLDNTEQMAEIYEFLARICRKETDIGEESYEIDTKRKRRCCFRWEIIFRNNNDNLVKSYRVSLSTFYSCRSVTDFQICGTEFTSKSQPLSSGAGKRLSAVAQALVPTVPEGDA